VFVWGQHESLHVLANLFLRISTSIAKLVSSVVFTVWEWILWLWVKTECQFRIPYQYFKQILLFPNFCAFYLKNKQLFPSKTCTILHNRKHNLFPPNISLCMDLCFIIVVSFRTQ
jgi:hypothetical protein